MCFFNIETYGNKRKSCFFRNDGIWKEFNWFANCKKLKLTFVDIDKEIEKELGISIKKIFETKGENFFRKFEEKITLKKLKLDSVVISLGGGAFINKSIRKEVLKSSVSFWLNWNTTILLKELNIAKKDLWHLMRQIIN